MKRLLFNSHILRRVALSLCRLVALSLCRLVALSLCRSIALSPCRSVALSLCRLVAIVVLLPSCNNAVETYPTETPLIAVPPGFPEQTFPADNTPTAERIELGKKLFFDPIMSSDITVSCASCHQPEHAFADNRSVSPGVAGRLGNRNAPSLFNVGYFPYYMREGGVPTLEMQVLAPIQEHSEMDINVLTIAERLNKDSTYARMSRDAYGREPDAFVITRAIASFERSLVSGEWRVESGERRVESGEWRGRELFFSERTKCSTCHGGFLYTDHSFQNNGLYKKYADRGRGRLTGKQQDDALFKVPSLWNVARTAPYMHDGSLATLQQVVSHYNSGGKDHPHKSRRVGPLGLSNEEQQDLVAFLTSLSFQ